MRSALLLFSVLTLGSLACTDAPSAMSADEEPSREALLERASDLSHVISAAGEIDADLRRTLDRLVVEIDHWNRAHTSDPIEMDVAPRSEGPALTAAAIWKYGHLFCEDCPAVIYQNGWIGFLTSEGPCTFGAGLERCFYRWIRIAI